MEQDQAFLDFIVRGIVSHPDDVVIERKVDEMGVLLTLKVNPEDMGQIIGRSGQTAGAIRTLLRTVGAKNNARLNLKIQEPEGRERPAPVSDSAPAESVTNEDVDELKL